MVISRFRLVVRVTGRDESTRPSAVVIDLRNPNGLPSFAGMYFAFRPCPRT